MIPNFFELFRLYFNIVTVNVSYNLIMTPHVVKRDHSVTLSCQVVTVLLLSRQWKHLSSYTINIFLS